MRTIRKYHNHTLQTKTRPNIIMHFIKQRNQFHFERKLYGQNCASVSVPFVPVIVEHVGGFVVCTLQVESSILLRGDVAYDARFSVCNKRNTFEIQSQDIIIRRLVTSPYKPMYFQKFWQKLLSQNSRSYNPEKVPNKRKLIYAIYIFIAASWCLLFSYGSHLNTTTNLNGIFWRR